MEGLKSNVNDFSLQFMNMNVCCVLVYFTSQTKMGNSNISLLSWNLITAEAPMSFILASQSWYSARTTALECFTNLSGLFLN